MLVHGYYMQLKVINMTLDRRLLLGLIGCHLISVSILAAQITKADTCLYVCFDKGAAFRIIHNGRTRIYENGMYRKYESPDSGFHRDLGRKVLPPDSYTIENGLGLGETFTGKSKDGYNRVPSKTISFKELRKYPVVTWFEVLAFVKANYKERRVEEYAPDQVNTVPPPSDPQGSINFWKNIRHIYMVEKDKKKKVATLTEVTLVPDSM
jgi:hypothetical protein